MKDKHNITLILVSSKWSSFFFPEFFIMSHFSIRNTSSFLFRISKFTALSHHEAPSKSLQDFTLSFQILFSFYHSFLNKALNGGSTWWFVKDSFHSSSVLQDCSWKSSSILHLAFQSAITSTLSLEMALYHSWKFSFKFRDSHVVKNEVFWIH